jgi:SAM-dependent methyltransferase
VLLHGIDPVRVQLIQSSDLADEIPLPDASVNYVHTSGVLHHTSKPAVLLRELARVLKPGGRGCVMVYNRDSLWFHLFTAYERMIVEGAFPGSDVLTAFRMNTDGSGCPISRCFTVDEFTALVDDAGLTAEYVGGYLSKQELTSLEHSWARALADDRLGPEHRAFLRHLRFDFRGFPMHNGVHAGIGGVYRLRKPSP